MNRFLKVAFVLIVFATNLVSFAQDDDSEEIAFEPINAVLYPSDSQLKFEESFGKKYQISFIGDELMFQTKKFNIVLSSPFTLPVNPNQDYIVEFNISTEKLKYSDIGIALGDYAIDLNFNKFVTVINVQDFTRSSNMGVKTKNNPGVLYSTKKWKTPVLEDKNSFVFKFERRRKLLIFYINDEYVFETQTKSPNVSPNEGLKGWISYRSFKKNPLILNSIKIEQGVVEE